MNDQADRADQREQHEPDRQQAAARVMDDKAEEVEPDQRRELRLACDASAKAIGNFDDPQLAAR